MKVLRYLLFCPVSIGLFFLLSLFIPWVLYYVLKIFTFIMFFGSGYDIDPVFGFEYDIENFKSFLFTVCLGWLVSAGISGFVGGKILPDKYRKFFIAVAAIIFGAIMVISGINFWDSEHWFYSSVIEVVLLLAILIYCGGLSIEE